MAKVIFPGDGILVICTGHIGHGGNGCGATISLEPKDLFTVGSLADPSDRNQAFRCPQCGVTSDLKINRVK
jgi:hypothetical protein